MKRIKIPENSKIHLQPLISEMCRHRVFLLVACLFLMDTETMTVPFDGVLYDELDQEILEVLDEDHLDTLTDEEMDKLIEKVKGTIKQAGRIMDTRRFRNDSTDFNESQTEFVPNCKRWQIC